MIHHVAQKLLQPLQLDTITHRLASVSNTQHKCHSVLESPDLQNQQVKVLGCFADKSGLTHSATILWSTVYCTIDKICNVISEVRFTFDLSRQRGRSRVLSNEVQEGLLLLSGRRSHWLSGDESHLPKDQTDLDQPIPGRSSPHGVHRLFHL